MTIYEIDNAIMEAYEKATNEDGEIIDERLFAQIEDLQLAREQKLENIACWIKDLEGDAAKIKTEAKTLTARAKAAENKAESLKRYLEWALAGEKFKTARCSISYRRSTRVEVDESRLYEIPEEFLHYKAPDVDKKRVGEAIKAGQEIPGCSITENVSMIIK